jgi:hypothetical protein
MARTHRGKGWPVLRVLWHRVTLRNTLQHGHVGLLLHRARDEIDGFLRDFVR